VAAWQHEKNGVRSPVGETKKKRVSGVRPKAKREERNLDTGAKRE